MAQIYLYENEMNTPPRGVFEACINGLNSSHEENDKLLLLRF